MHWAYFNEKSESTLLLGQQTDGGGLVLQMDLNFTTYESFLKSFSLKGKQSESIFNLKVLLPGIVVMPIVYPKSTFVYGNFACLTKTRWEKKAMHSQ